MQTLSAANKLRSKVLTLPGIVVLTSAGHPDKVIRFQVMPEVLVKLEKDKDEGRGYLCVNLDRGPDQEAWRDAMDVTRRTARRDVPIPDPLAVSEDCHSDWSVGEEDVPTIENAIEIVSVQKAREDEFKCTECPKTFTSESGVKIHKSRAHKEI